MDAQKAILGVLEAVVSLEIIEKYLLKVLLITMVYGMCSNNIVEATTRLQGIKLFLDIGKEFVVVESDTLLIMEIITKRAKPTWQIRSIIEHIWRWTRNGNFLFVHAF